MIVYKLVRKLKDNKLYPLFIDKKRSYVFHEKRYAECIPTKGFALRTGFHCCIKPYAPHLKMKLSNGENRVWMECEVEDYTFYDRPESQGGKWVLANILTAIRELSFSEVENILNNENGADE